MLWDGHHYDRLIADTGRLGVEAAQARAEAAAARRSLDEANWLHEQLAGNKRRLEAEVGLLKVEAAKVAEAQQALVEADQQRGQLADDKGRLQAEVYRLRGQVTTVEGALQDEALCREAAEKAAEDKDAELKVALAKAADLEKALEEIDKLETTRIEADAYDRWNEHFAPFLLLGALLAFAAVTVSMASARRIA